MKYSETLIIKAFLAALIKQQSPLPAAIEQQLTEIAQSLPTKLGELDKLAENIPELKIPYEAAYLCFSLEEAERNKGLDFLPSAEGDEDSSLEMDNITLDTRQIVLQMKEVLDKIEEKFNEKEAAQILASSNSVQATKQKFQ
jgi:hypothetical protein